MKKPKLHYLLLIICVILTGTISNAYAQIVKTKRHQTVIKNFENKPVLQKQVKIKVSILNKSKKGTVLYTETHTAITDSKGTIILNLGSGKAVAGNYASINWDRGPYYIRTETDILGGTNYQLKDTQLFTAAPRNIPGSIGTRGGGRGGSRSVGEVADNKAPTPKDGKDGKDGVDGKDGKDGVDGKDGKDGVDGKDGKDGVDGKDGQSAYQVWLALGNTGSEADFITSLKGEAATSAELPQGRAAGDLLAFDGTNWVAKRAVTQQVGASQAVNNMPPYLTVNYIIALQGTFPSRTSSDPFLGQIIMFGGNFAPRGWAFCNGQLMSVSEYSALFSLLGTIYGGDGRTTFALPDLRGRVPIHAGSGPGLTRYHEGRKGGSETNTLTPQQLPAHNHVISFE